MPRTTLICIFCYFLRFESANFRRAAIKSHKNLARRIVARVLARKQKATALMTIIRALPMGSSIISNDMQIARFLRARDIFLHTHVVHNDMQSTAVSIEKADEYSRIPDFSVKNLYLVIDFISKVINQAFNVLLCVS